MEKEGSEDETPEHWREGERVVGTIGGLDITANDLVGCLFVPDDISKETNETVTNGI